MTQRITEKAVNAVFQVYRRYGVSHMMPSENMLADVIAAALPHLQCGTGGGWKTVAARVENDADPLGLSLTRQQKRRLANIKSGKSIVRRALSPASAQGVDREKIIEECIDFAESYLGATTETKQFGVEVARAMRRHLLSPPSPAPQTSQDHGEPE